MVILNQVAVAEPHQMDAARKIIRSLNADTRIIETNHPLRLRTRFDAALLPAVVAGGPEALVGLMDPFQVWRRAEAAA